MNQRFAYAAKHYWLAFALVVLGTTALYVSALRLYFLSDDFILYAQGLEITSLARAFAIDPNWFFYRPLGQALWMLQAHLFADRGVFYHAVSLGLHTANSCMLVAIARWYLPRTAALLAGLLFALSPLNVEAVAWLACQYDLLATCGMLAAIVLLDMACQRRSVPIYLASLAAFQLGLWSKESAFVFPVLAAIALGLRKQRPPLTRLGLSLAPFGILLALNLVQRYVVWGRFGGYPGVGLLPTEPVVALQNTAQTLLAPLNQLQFPRLAVLAIAGTTACLMVVGAVLARERRALIVGALWLLVALLPTLGLLPIGADMQNSRIMYLASLGWSLLLAGAMLGIGQRLPKQAAVTGAVVLVVSSGWFGYQNLVPWQVAASNVLHVLEETHRLLPHFPADSRLQTVGLPDNYRGAYIYRLGFVQAFGQHYGSGFALEPIDALEPLRYDIGGMNAQMRYAWSEPTKHWEVIAARYTTPDLALAPDAAQWDLANCPGEWRGAACDSQGFQLSKDVLLESPLLVASPLGWQEVVVVAKTLPTNTSDMLRLEWRAESGDWVSREAQTINLSPSGGTFAYHFLLSPGDGGQPLERIRLSATGQVVVQAIAVRHIP